ncbi:MAG: flagellar basal body-associated FliL family protein [Deltaproteobacteria bacterium]|nr:flagellar basal body-associated FliL family protein [Deltaproteobacteria bacterium]
MKIIYPNSGKLELKKAIILRMNQILGNKTARRIYFTEFVVQ